jgi:hypothetical protein
MMGARLMDRLGAVPGTRLTLVPANGGGDSVTIIVGARLEAGGADDEAFWIPLASAQRVGGHTGRASLAQARVEGAQDAGAVVASLEQGGTLRALVLHALSATEGRLLERMRRLMARTAALAVAGLAAFGTVTDLAPSAARRRPGRAPEPRWTSCGCSRWNRSSSAPWAGRSGGSSASGSHRSSAGRCSTPP